MRENTNIQETRDLILRDFDLTTPERPFTEAEMIDYLGETIAYMLDNKMDFLMSLLYRLDIDEQKIAHALLPGNPEPANRALAHLVWERQKQRVASKKAYRNPNTTQWNWED